MFQAHCSEMSPYTSLSGKSGAFRIAGEHGELMGSGQGRGLYVQARGNHGGIFSRRGTWSGLCFVETILRHCDSSSQWGEVGGRETWGSLARVQGTWCWGCDTSGDQKDESLFWTERKWVG